MRSFGALVATCWMLAGCGGDISVGPAPTDAAARERQAQAFVEALKPRQPGRPVVAVLARNAATEITDFLLSHAVLQRAGVADVHAVAPRRGRVALYPALQVEVAHDFASFERAYPAGPDYVIVPAMLFDQSDDPEVTRWLKRQAERGARVIGVCAGALVVGSTGLLDGRRATTHWYFRKMLLERHPKAVYVPHQRYVIDRDVATTTGITASVPAMLALVEAIGGRDRAQALASELGVDAWTPAHDSTQFGLNTARRVDYLLSKAAFWRNEHWAVDVHDGIDDIPLAFAVDAWSRTGHIRVEASASRPVKLRSGLTLVARPIAKDTPRVPLSPAVAPVRQLDRTLCEIADRFGESRRAWVANELEYAGGACN